MRKKLKILRRGESEREINPGSGAIRLLVRSSRLEGMVVELEPHAEIPMVYSHEGEELRIVLEGEVEVEVEGERHLLREGDFMWFDSSLKHRIRNPGDKKAVYFSVNSPPSLKW
ncbi:MAG: cupin domain-containing protein [Euryarchaeota archaeon]|nr:cupin domain-containing protein [Euryarchaeota archaeon]